jgi:tRNA A37 methylthiotransferase MiaB
MFAYSLREKTHAHRSMQDNVPSEIKQQRLAEVINTFNKTTLEHNKKDIGSKHLVLIEGVRTNLLLDNAD